MLYEQYSIALKAMQCFPYHCSGLAGRQANERPRQANNRPKKRKKKEKNIYIYFFIIIISHNIITIQAHHQLSQYVLVLYAPVHEISLY